MYTSQMPNHQFYLFEYIEFRKWLYIYFYNEKQCGKPGRRPHYVFWRFIYKEGETKFAFRKIMAKLERFNLYK